MKPTSFNNRIGTLRVAPNQHYLEFDDGSPFFYLGDTAWELFHRLDLDEATYYLENRATKGFTVIQALVLAELKGLDVPNANGLALDRPGPHAAKRGVLPTCGCCSCQGQRAWANDGHGANLG